MRWRRQIVLRHRCRVQRRGHLPSRPRAVKTARPAPQSASGLDPDHADQRTRRNVYSPAPARSSPRTSIWPTGATPRHLADRADQFFDPVVTLTRFIRRCQYVTSTTPHARLTTPPTTFHGSGRMRKSTRARATEHHLLDHPPQRSTGTSSPLGDEVRAPTETISGHAPPPGAPMREGQPQRRAFCRSRTARPSG